MVKPSEKLAELIGIMLGDGNLYHNTKGYQYMVRVGNHTNDDMEYRGFINKLFKSLFNKNMHSYQYKEKETVLVCYNKDIFLTLESYGLPRGNKKLNNVGIPNWIMKNKNFLKACVRGIIDTDGSVFPKSRNPNLPQIEVSSRTTKLRNTFRRALFILGFKPSNWSKGSNTPNCGLYSKEQVYRYFNEIGFNNPKHMKKFINISKIKSIRP